MLVVVLIAYIPIGLTLCLNYDIAEAKDFVEMYVAYSVSKLNGAEPSIETLEEFERKELTNYKSKRSARNANREAHQSKNFEDFEHFNGVADDDVDEIMDSYVCKTPKVSNNTVLFRKFI